MLSLDLVQKAVPANLKNAVTQTLVDKINTISSEPLIAEQIRDNFISYTGVLKEGKFKTEDYLNAVAFVSTKHILVETEIIVKELIKYGKIQPLKCVYSWKFKRSC